MLDQLGIALVCIALLASWVLIEDHRTHVFLEGEWYMPHQRKYVIGFSYTGTHPDDVCDMVTDMIDAWVDEHGEVIEIVQVIPQMVPVPQYLLVGGTVYGTQYNYTVTIVYVGHDETVEDSE